MTKQKKERAEMNSKTDIISSHSKTFTYLQRLVQLLEILHQETPRNQPTFL